ncbi:MAG: Peptidoglycan-binding LysM [Planctomycetaceae bacterium]|nr:Peptidoglycan-binding LysM [Planctomycetaceae bacterium]
MQQPQQQPQHRPADASAAHVAQTQASHAQPRTVVQQQTPQQPVARTVPQAAPQAAPKDDDHESSDWGLAPTKPGFSRENKFILFVLLVLVAVFSFVVFRNFQKKQNGTKAGEVAAKDAKKDAKPNAKGGAKSEDNEVPPLQELGDAGAETIAAGGAKELEADPFANAPATEAAPPAGGENAIDMSQAPAELAQPEGEAPPQLNVSNEEAPAQARDLFEGPADMPAATEIAEATPPARRGRHVRSQPEMVENVPAELNGTAEAEPMSAAAAQFEATQPPMETADFNAEPAAESNLAQTAGTGVEPIAKKRTAPRAGGLETAQLPPPADQFGVPQDPSGLTTTPRVTNPRGTAPRTAVAPTPAPPGTQPRVGTVPPPLNPQDERLGGYREGALPPVAPAHRTASRPHAPVAGGHLDPHSEPLVANIGEYIVRPNDNFWRISRKVYGTARYFAALAKHNEAIIPDPKHIKPGIKISTPAKEQLEQQYHDLLPVMAAPRPMGAVMHSPAAPATPGFYVESDGQPAYRIGPTDTLSTISRKTLGRASRWDEIYELNKDRLTGADALAVGSILRLPPDASQTRVVGKPVEHR